jgi:ribonuclease D
MGLNPHRDRLCLVQLSAGDGDAHLVQIAQGGARAPNLTALLADPDRAEALSLRPLRHRRAAHRFAC